MKKRHNKSSGLNKNNAGTPHNTQKTTGSTRRGFLATTAAGAGLFLVGKAAAQDAAAPAPAPAEPVPAAPAAETAPAPAPAPAPAIIERTPDTLNIAIIGTGAEGQVLLEAMSKIPGLRFKAVCDIWRVYNQKIGVGRLKKAGHIVNAYEDYREMLDKEKDLDAVIVATPDFVHAEQAIACMKAGLHVYCEKEMSNSLEKARQMVLASRETGKLLQIGHQRRSNPRYHHAINRVLHEQKLIGRLTQGFAQWNRAKSVDLAWPKSYPIPPETLEKYGYESMDHFRNWRWYKKYGGGPIVDLGSHQIDIFTWVYQTTPKSVSACGGIDFYTHHEWYDNVMAIFDYDSPDGTTRAFYQVLTTTSNGGFYESFSGEYGTLVISEVPPRGDHVFREQIAPEWDQYAKQGLLLLPDEPASQKAKTRNTVIDTRVSPEPDKWILPVVLNKPAHQPHLENFFDAIRNGVPLNCPGEIGYETAVAVLKVNDAVDAGQKLHFQPQEFLV